MADPDQLSRPRLYFLAAMLILVGILALLVFIPFGTYVLMGAFIAYLAWPAYDRLRRRLEGHDRIAAFLVLLLVTAIVIVPLLYIGLVIFQEATRFATSFAMGEIQTAIETVVSQLYRLVGLEPPDSVALAEIVPALVDQARRALIAILPELVGRLIEVAIGVFIMAFTIYYALVDGEEVIAFVRSLTPLSADQDRRMADLVGRTVKGAFFGQIAVAALQGVVGAIGFWLFGVPSPILLGVVLGIFAIIPVVGQMLVWLPVGLVLLLLGDTFAGVGVLIWGATVVSLIDNVARPYIVGRSAHLHPLVVLVGVLGGIVAFGWTGFVIGPLILAVFMGLLEFYREDVADPNRPADRDPEPDPEAAG